MVGTARFEARIKELVENVADLVVLVEPLLIVRRVLREQIGALHRRLLAIVRDDEVCRRLMTAERNVLLRMAPHRRVAGHVIAWVGAAALDVHWGR